MWDSPRQLNVLSACLALLAGALLAWGAIAWAVRQPLFALRHVIVEGPLAHTNAAYLETVIREELKGTFYTLDLAEARASLQRLPWVKRVALRRQWPDRLLITVIEHEPLARWNDAALVDSEGEPFSADFGDELPQFSGPDGSSVQVVEHFREFSAILAPAALAVAELRLSLRGGWRLRTTGSAALAIELGRDAAVERLSRFAAYQRQTVGALARLGARVNSVDLRYRNGFALRVQDGLDNAPRKAGQGREPW